MHLPIRFQLTGVAPLIMHNGQLADPMGEFPRAIKKLTAKKTKKTEADLAEMARLEWRGGLYVDDEDRIIVPGTCIEGALVEAAKQVRLGKQFKAGMICDGNWRLDYDGPNDPDKLYERPAFRDTRGVIVSRSRVMRTRPIFPRWSLTCDVHYLPTVLNPGQVVEAMQTAGQIVGLCDYRPRYGRFDVEVLDVAEVA